MLSHNTPTAGHPGQDETFTSSPSHAYGCPDDGHGSRITLPDVRVSTEQNGHPSQMPTTNTTSPIRRCTPIPTNALDLILGCHQQWTYTSVANDSNHGCSLWLASSPAPLQSHGVLGSALSFDNVYRWLQVSIKFHFLTKTPVHFTLHAHSTNKIGATKTFGDTFPPQPIDLAEWKNQLIEHTCASSQTHNKKTEPLAHSGIHSSPTSFNATRGSSKQVLLGSQPFASQSECPSTQSDGRTTCGDPALEIAHSIGRNQ